VSVHVRFAPSPTGSLHLGSGLTALLNRLFARSREGSLLLRIDDTDTDRSRPELEAGILRDLKWLGIGWDEGPVRQSERFDEYREAAAGAVGVEIRAGACWLRPPGLAPFVILRGDGRATYNWASAVDDLRDGISHVIRGNDHLSNTPLQEAAILALGGKPPQYLHHAVITGETGKLSKREGASSITDLRLAGYPPEAVVNYLGLIGTSGPGDVLSMDDLVERFDASRMARGTLQLDLGRLRALSTRHLAALPADDLIARVLERCPPGTPEQAVRAMEPALRGVHTLAEAAELVDCVLVTPEHEPLPELARIRALYPERLDEPGARELVDELRRSHVPLRQARRALTGRDRGPELWAVFAALPRDEAIRRAT
jgi:glutamyl/glutaminyl-tRNA synthetase